MKLKRQHRAPLVEYKATKIEVKDLSLEKRTAVIAFATFGNIDRYKDIMGPNSFDKTWSENKSDIKFFLNHDPYQAPGKTLELFKDTKHAYGKAWLGTHTLGEDTLKMMDEGIATDASFGYSAIKSTMIKDESVRLLDEVKQYEFSVLTAWGANPLSKVTEVQKSFEHIQWLQELKESIVIMKKFCRETKASDECIIKILSELKKAQSLIAKYSNTASTPLIKEPKASDNFDDDEDDADFVDTPDGDGDITCPECGSPDYFEEDEKGMLQCKDCDAYFMRPQQGQSGYTPEQEEKLLAHIELLKMKA